MHPIRSSAPSFRALLALPVALALSACTYPNDIGDSPTASDSDTSTSEGDSTASTTASSQVSTSTSPGDDTDGTASTEPSTSSSPGDDEVTTSTVTGEGFTTSTVTGDVTSSTGTTTTPPPDPPGGKCVDENHGEYWCECSEGQTKSCGDDGVSVCFAASFVITEFKWGPCGVCAPGDSLACDAGGQPGQQFCNLDSEDLWLDDIDNPPTAVWGVCIAEADIVCQPGFFEPCDGGFVDCFVDDQGVPYWGKCD